MLLKSYISQYHEADEIIWHATHFCSEMILKALKLSNNNNQAVVS